MRVENKSAIQRLSIVFELLFSAVVVGSATTITILYKLSPPARTLETGFSLGLALLLSIYCAALFLFECRRGRLFSPLNFYAALIGVHFAAPALLLSNGWLSFRYGLNVPYLVDCLFFVLLCLALFQAGTVMAGRTRVGNRRNSQIRAMLWSVGKVALVVGVISGVGWLARLYLISQGAYFQLDRANADISTWGAMFVLLELFPIYGYVILLVGYFHRIGLGTKSRVWLITLTLAAGAEFVYWIGAGRKLESILVLVLALVIRYLAIRRLPSRKTMLVGVVTILMIFPLTFYYRYSLETEFGLGTDLASIPDIVSQAVSSADAAGPAVEIILNRLNLNESVSAAIRLIESGEWKVRAGSSYADIFLILIPRFLWDDKPDYHYGTEFGHASGLSALSDELTSISVTYFGEAYLNLLWAGCAIFFVVAYLAEKLYIRARDGTDPKWLLLYGLTLSPLLYVGGTAAMYFGGLIRLLILFYLISLSFTAYRVVVEILRKKLQPALTPTRLA